MGTLIVNFHDFILILIIAAVFFIAQYLEIKRRVVLINRLVSVAFM